MTHKFLLASLELGTKSCANTAFLRLKTCLENNKHLSSNYSFSFRHVGAGVNPEASEIFAGIRSLNPDSVGFICYPGNLSKVLAVCRLLKEWKEDTTIILGGPEVSPRAQSFLEKFPHADVVVRGEGEITLQKLLEVPLESGPDLDEVLGITFRKGDQVYSTADRPEVENLDDLPSPYRPSNLKFLRNSSVWIENQRGCPRSCAFCSNRRLQPPRKHSPARIKRDLEFLGSSEVNLQNLHVIDPIFNLEPEWAKEILRLIMEHLDDRTGVDVQMNLLQVDDELARLLGEAEVKVTAGPESYSPEVNADVDRHFSREKFEENYSKLKYYGVDLRLTAITGLPAATGDTVFTTLKNLLKLEPEELAIFPLLATPGSKLWRSPDDYGINFLPFPPHNTTESRYLSKTDLLSLHRLGIATYLIHSYFDSHETFEEAEKLLEVANDWVENSDYWTSKNHAAEVNFINEKRAEKDFERFLSRRGNTAVKTG